jgi:hypothetical protein
MFAETSRSELQSLIEREGMSVESMALEDGLRIMLNFYETLRAENCINPPERDMLLYQFGTYDWGKGKFFEVDLTRQFISPAARRKVRDKEGLLLAFAQDDVLKNKTLSLDPSCTR